jgi:hypothetical protein
VYVDVCSQGLSAQKAVYDPSGQPELVFKRRRENGPEDDQKLAKLLYLD